MVSPDPTSSKRSPPARRGDPCVFRNLTTCFWKGSWDLFIKVSLGLSLLECFHVGRPRDFFQSLKKKNKNYFS